MDTKKILEGLTDMGCDEKEISFMKKMYRVVLATLDHDLSEAYEFGKTLK